MHITHLHAVELAVDELAAAVDWYSRFLGVAPSAQSDSEARFTFANAPQLRLRTAPSHRLAFGVADVARAARRLKRLSIDGSAVDATPAQVDLPLQATGGIALGLVEAAVSRVEPAVPSGEAIAGVELVLLTASDRVQAMAMYGAVLGLELQLDKALPGGHRLQQYPCGDTLVEVTQTGDPAAARDTLVGMGWRVHDIHAAHARLQAAGFALSEVRAGMKPGTQTFTVREVIGGLRFIVIQGP